jgi:hypothetical protein
MMKIVWAGSALATLFLVLLLSTEIIKRGRLEKAFSELTPTERRTSATACFQDAPDVSYLMRMGSSHPNQTEGIGSRTPHNAVEFCPIPSDPILPHSKITHVEIRGKASICHVPPDRSCFVILAFICVSFANSADGKCTDFKKIEASGDNYVIEFKDGELWPWLLYPFGYPYVHVRLTPPSLDGDTSTLRGITVSEIR